MGVNDVHDIPVDEDVEKPASNGGQRPPERRKWRFFRLPVISPLLWILNVAAVAAFFHVAYSRAWMGSALSFVSKEDEPVQERIRRISSLAPLKVVVSDFASVDSGGVKALYHVKGDALIGVDLSGMVISGGGGGRISVSGLAQPKVSRARVDGDATELVDQKRGLFTSQKAVGEMHALVLEEAERRIRAAASSDDVANAARRRAEALLGAMYSRMGYKVGSFGWAGKEAQ